MNMSFIIRAVVLTLCLIPYVYFGVRDVLHHKQHRKVSLTERLLHLSLGLTLAIVIPHAYLGHLDVVIPGVTLFVLARVCDEFVFHRGLTSAEVDLHAKTHFGFLIFVVGVMGADWLQRQSYLQ
jgi:hypothetical protein